MNNRKNMNDFFDTFQQIFDTFGPILENAGTKYQFSDNVSGQKDNFEKNGFVIETNGLVNVIEKEDEAVILMTAVGFDKFGLEIEASETQEGDILIRIKNKELNDKQKEIIKLMQKATSMSFTLNDFKIKQEIIVSKNYDI
jgi:HSP20 family molecular chaperone IbpA